MNGDKNFKELALGQYAELEKQEKELKSKLEEIQKQKTPLKTYLQSAGMMEIKRRGPRRKKNVDTGEAK